jgi:hypothetical protein
LQGGCCNQSVRDGASAERQAVQPAAFLCPTSIGNKKQKRCCDAQMKKMQDFFIKSQNSQVHFFLCLGADVRAVTCSSGHHFPAMGWDGSGIM